MWYSCGVMDGQRVLVGLSGGVDSAAAACLLQEQGYDVVAGYLCLQRVIECTNHRSCCSPQDAEDAEKVADVLGVKLLRLPVTHEFLWLARWTAGEYAAGRTPNPCVVCNMRIKLRLLGELADRVGAARVATGHYARQGRIDGLPRLGRAANAAKDQSYVLFGLDEAVRARLLLPLAGIADKRTVRELAARRGLSVSNKAESQDACFLPSGGVRGLLRQYAPEALREGAVVADDGRPLGRHDGYACYTVGQRRGLGVAGGQRLYVSRVDAVTATVTLGPRGSLQVSGLRASGAVWHCPVPPRFRALVQVRYTQTARAAEIELLADGGFDVRFLGPIDSAAPGQAAVVYDEEGWIIGGGWIDETWTEPGTRNP